MAENECDRVLPIIRTIYELALHLYRNLREGRDFEECNEQEFNLPESIKNKLFDTVLEVGTRRILDDYDSLLRSSNRVEILEKHYIKLYHHYKRKSNATYFINWTLKCCVIAANLFEEGFTEAPDIAMEAILSKCENCDIYMEHTDQAVSIDE